LVRVPGGVPGGVYEVKPFFLFQEALIIPWDFTATNSLEAFGTFLCWGGEILFRLTGDCCVCGVDGMHSSEKRTFFFDQDEDELVHYVSGIYFFFLTEGIVVK